MKKFTQLFLICTLVISILASPQSTFAYEKGDLNSLLDEGRSYIEHVEVEDNESEVLLFNTNSSAEKELDELNVILENAVVVNNSYERNVTTLDEHGNEIKVHFDKANNKLTIISDSYTEEEIKEAEQQAQELADFFGNEENVIKTADFTTFAISDGPWTKTSPQSGSTSALKTTVTLTGIFIAGYMGITGLPGGILAVATWVFDNKVPVIWYNIQNYYKRVPVYTTKKVWQWYKNSAKTQKIGSTYTTYKEFYD